MEKMSIQTTTPMTPLQWETTLSKVTSIVDSIPLAKGRQTNAYDLGYELLTPNRLKMGRNNARTMMEGAHFTVNHLPSEILHRNREITENFYCLLTERVHHLIMKPNKWNHTQENIPKVNDVVLFILNDSATGLEWRIGRVTEVEETKAKITYAKKCERTDTIKKNVVEQGFRSISIILAEDEIPLNSTDYLQQL